MTLSKNEQEFIVEQMRRVVTCKGSQWECYAVEVFKEPTGGFCYKFQPDLGSWTCVDSHRITFMRHNKHD